MTTPFTAILLAGGIRRAPISEALRLPTLCLPLAPGRPLLAEWLDLLHSIGDCESVSIVFSSDDDVESIEALLATPTELRRFSSSTHAFVEPRRWRGTAGVIRDSIRESSANLPVVVVEAAALPPPGATSIVGTLAAGAAAAIGIDDDTQPAGIYAFQPDVLEMIPTVGFYDIKEQLLPHLYAHGRAARPIRVIDHAVRLRDRDSYLSIMKDVIGGDDTPANQPCVSPACKIPDTALLTGANLIDHGVILDNHVVVDNSVILTGAAIGGGAVVSRSIVGPKTQIPPSAHIIDAIVSHAEPVQERRLPADAVLSS